MATKNAKNLKNAKKVIKTSAEIVDTEIETIVPTDEELFLGAEEGVKEVKVTDYLSINTKYTVTVYTNGRKIKANGKEIGTFLGLDSIARKKLKEGAKEVLILDHKDRELYKIEVL